CISGVESKHDVRRVLHLGERVPLWEGPASKVILAHLPTSERDQLLLEVSDDKRRRHTALQISAALDKGYIAVVGDRTSGTAGVAAAIFDMHGVVGSMAVSGPVNRWSMKRMEEYAPSFLNLAATVSWKLGGQRHMQANAHEPLASLLPLKSTIDANRVLFP